MALLDQSAAVLLALAAMVLWGFEEFYLKKSIAKIRSITTYLINTIAGTLLYLLAIYLFFDFNVSVVSLEDFALLLVATILAFWGYYSFYKAIQKQELSLISSLDESWIIVSILIGVFFLGEALTLLQVVSILAVLLGAFLISAVNVQHLRKIRLISGAGYEFFCIVLIGITIPIEKIIVERIGEANTLFYLGLLIIPVVFIGKLFIKESFVKPTWRDFKIATYSGLFDGAAFIFYLAAINRGEVSIISPIVASSVVVTVFLGHHFLNEKMSKRQILGALIILIAVVFLSTSVGY